MSDATLRNKAIAYDRIRELLRLPPMAAPADVVRAAKALVERSKTPSTTDH
ncbi:hypothetical protein [Luteolibacter marinus]|uniref:hypothetical protein n=1 Tax=Luteolibacter marinus TaxID=2776705 RepID=UPI0018668898|nr:hypothetical protein [Luteolibacter marinus]